MTAEEKIAERWKILTVDIADDVRQKWWDIIIQKYTAPHRKYHNILHIQQVFEHFDAYKDYLQSPDAVAYAIIFHDLEYDPNSSNNEDMSVQLFEAYASEANILKDSPLYSQVIELVTLTSTHSTDEHKTEGTYGQDDKHFFLDFDMSILGSSTAEYNRYAEQISEEYNFLPKPCYKLLRAKVLKSFLMIPNIFATKEFRDLYESKARENIQREISELES